MSQLLVSFIVPPEHRGEIVRIAARTARGRLVNQAGSRRFEVTTDDEEPKVVDFTAVYADVDVVDTQVSDRHLGTLSTETSTYVRGPSWVPNGNLVGDKVTA